MKVVCINNGPIGVYNKVDELTVGKLYDANIDGDTYWIIADNGYKGWYDKERFADISYIREEKLKQLGI